MFIDILVEKIKKANNPAIVGLDPDLSHIPDFLKEKAFKEFGRGIHGIAEAIVMFNKKIIDAVCDITAAVKPQLAYYERYGAEGVGAFAETCAYAKRKGLLVIADGKRNDIGSTAGAYSEAYLGRCEARRAEGGGREGANGSAGDFSGFGETIKAACFSAGTGKARDVEYGASDAYALVKNGSETDIFQDGAAAFDTDALTVNPYLGYDGIKPFIDCCARNGKGVFVLVKTSNRSSVQLQDIVAQNGKRIYEIVAELVDEWGAEVVGKSGYSAVGAVVGATYPEQAKILRKIMKKAYILVPGYGAQGGTAADAAQAFDENGLGAVVNASRSVLCAWKSEMWRNKYDEKSFDAAAREEAIRMRDDINAALERR